MFFFNISTVCAVTLLGANAENTFTIPVGKIFTYQLLRETFQNDFEPLAKLYGRSLNHFNPLFISGYTKRTGADVHRVYMSTLMFFYLLCC